MEIDFMHSENFKDSKDFKDSEETSVHRRNNNIEIVIGNEIDDKSLLQRHQEGLEEPIRGSNLFYNGVNQLYYKLHKISSNRSGSYIDSPK